MCERCGIDNCNCAPKGIFPGIPLGKPLDTVEIQKSFERIEAREAAERDEENARRKKAIEDFVCRVCDGHGCTFVPTGEVFFGGDITTQGHYECNTCSVHFSDPEKFSKPKGE